MLQEHILLAWPALQLVSLSLSPLLALVPGTPSRLCLFTRGVCGVALDQVQVEQHRHLSCRKTLAAIKLGSQTLEHCNEACVKAAVRLIALPTSIMFLLSVDGVVGSVTETSPQSVLSGK